MGQYKFQLLEACVGEIILLAIVGHICEEHATRRVPCSGRKMTKLYFVVQHDTSK